MFVAKKDFGRCRVCGYSIVEGDEVTGEGEEYLHNRCAEDVKDFHIVEWRTADSMARADIEGLETARVAPLGKQGKCPVCFLELPMTRICDEHGMVKA